MQKVEHDRRTGSRCEYIEPNVKESALLYDGDELVGVYFQSLPEKYEKLEKLMAVANHEFLSDRVPKDLLERSDVMILQKKLNITRAKAKKIGTVQQSTIIGTDRQTLTQLTPEDRHKTWGLGWGDQGLWHITAKQNQVYDITVIFKEKHQVPVGYVELAIGRNLYHERYNGEHKQTFHDVSISKGDHVIYSTLFNWGVGRGSNDAFAAPYQIIINRK